MKNLESCSLKDASIFKYFNIEIENNVIMNKLQPITILMRKFINN